MKDLICLILIWLAKTSVTLCDSNVINSNGENTNKRNFRKERAVLFPSASTIGVSANQ